MAWQWMSHVGGEKAPSLAGVSSGGREWPPTEGLGTSREGQQWVQASISEDTQGEMH